MGMNAEDMITIAAIVISLVIVIFAVDWRYFRDWVVVFLFKCVIDLIWGSAVVNMPMVEYPVRLLPRYFETCILFELWVFPILCVWYNHITRRKGIVGIVTYALLFSAGISAIEYPIEIYTDLLHYITWNVFTTFGTLLITLLLSRSFIAFFRWGCDYFENRGSFPYK